MKLSTISPSSSRATLILGPPGTGKTTFLTQIPNIRIFELDNNIAGPLDFIRANNLSEDADIIVPHISDDGKLIDRKDRYPRLCDKASIALAEPEVKAIGIDGLTSFVDYAMDEVRRQQGRKMGVFNPTSPSIKSIDENLQIQDWGAFAALLKHFVITLKASGKPSFWTAHIANDKDDMAGYLKTFLACPGQMKELFAGYFDEVILLSKIEEGNPKKTVVKIQTVPAPRQESLGLKSSLWKVNGETLDLTKLKTLLA